MNFVSKIKPIKKRILSVSLACALSISACIVTGGCSTGKTASKGSVNLTVWTYMQYESPTLKKYADQWAKKTGNKVNLIWEQASVQQFAQAAHSSSGPDIIYGIPNDLIGTFATAGLIKKVPTGIINDSDYTPSALKSCSIGNQRYAIPIALETAALFYNPDKVKTVPKTMESLIEQAPKQGGFMYKMTDFYYDYGFLRAEGGYVFNDKNGNYNAKDIGLGNKGSIKAYGLLQDLVTKYKLIPSDITGDIAKSKFQNGELAYYISGPWDISGFKSAGTHYKIAPLPTLNGQHMKTAVGTQVAFVSKYTKHESEAWDLIKYLSDNSALALYKVGSRIPVKVSVQNSSAVKNNSDVQAFIKQAAYGESMPTIPELSAVWTPEDNNIKLLITGKTTPQKAASDVVDQVKKGIGTMDTGK